MIKIFFGNNKAEILLTKKQQIIDAKDQKLELERLNIDSLNTAQIQQFLGTSSLFSDKRFIAIEAKKIDQELLNIISDITKDNDNLYTTIYITELDKRNSIYKILKDNRSAVELKLKSEYELADWIITQAKDSGIVFTKANANYLINKVGSDQVMLMNEVQKLSTLTDKCSNDLIDKYIESSDNSTIFDFLDQLFTGSPQNKKIILDQLYNLGNKPVYIISMIAWYLNILLLIVHAPNNLDSNDIARSSGFGQYAITKARATTTKMSKSKIVKILESVEWADETMKTKSIGDKDILEDLVFNKI